MIKLSPHEIAGERLHGERTDPRINLDMLDDYLAGLEARFRRAVEPQPRSLERDQALEALNLMPYWREFALGVAEAVRQLMKEGPRETR